jgi:hypothetical protein
MMPYDFLKPYLFLRRDFKIHLVNESKIIEVVALWFDYFNYTLDFIHNNQKDVSLLNSVLIKKSILYSFDIFEDDFTFQNNKNNCLLKDLLSYFLFAKVGYLPAGLGDKKLEKLKFKLLSYKIENLKIVVNSEFKFAYFEYCNKIFDQKIISVLREIIPDSFFATRLIKDYNLPYILKGSPLSFLDFNYNYVKLLLQPKNVKIIGIQHGGVYGEWNNNPFEDYEKRISDSYFGWGLSQHNIIQNRFKKKKISSLEQTGVFWFGRNKYYVPQAVDFGNVLFENLANVNHIKYFYDFFQDFNVQLLPHPRLSNPIYRQIFDPEKIISTVDSISHVSNARLIIFDCISHTLMYYCLFNKIPFVIVVDKWPIIGLSSSAVKFYEILYKKNMLLFKDDVYLLKKIEYLKNYTNNLAMSLYDSELQSYVENTFLSNKTIDLI